MALTNARHHEGMKRLLAFFQLLFPKQYHLGQERFSAYTHTYTEREIHVARRRVALTPVEKLAL
ncbi:hypothetical protein D3875_16585 [Deinococcus cavernae]|uniref:Uncharacterized protein n=2 Tax=Deinococcaceae TaxID=183710 RepID=A0A418VA19_9DEIO|nr:hypothetical protein D3875_16585 [Deinococcus cavernae]